MSSTSSMRGGKRTRPLGALRHTAPPEEAKVQFPKLTILSKAEDEKIDVCYSGIQGNAITLPTAKEPTIRSEERRKSVPSVSHKELKPLPRTNSGSNDVSHEVCEREMKEVLGRERELKDKIAQLQHLIHQQTVQLSEKEKVIRNHTADLTTKEADFKQQLEEERAKHAATRQVLEKTQAEIADAIRHLEEKEKEHKEKLEFLRVDMMRQVMELGALKDKEIADRDQKLNRLKMQMADALKGNSWERQQQLEELTKDLARIQDECDMLRSKLKQLSKGKPGQCANCAESASRAEKLATLVKEREVTIKDLKSLCARLEKQLTQQDVLLKQWADSKGHKVELPK